MRSTYVQCVFLAVLLLSGTAEADELEIFERPAPAQQQRPFEVEVAPTATSITGERVVSIKLDDTGIQDWRFMNPRRPQGVNVNTIIEFENQTADRTFEVTTNLTLNPGVLVPELEQLPITVPLLIYDALTLDDDLTTPPARPIPLPDELISDYEKRLIELAKAEFPRFAETIGEVLELEEALRLRAEKLSAEVEKRAVVIDLKPGQPPSSEPRAKVEDIAPAVDAYEKASASRKEADQQVEMLTIRDKGLEKRRKALIDALSEKAKGKRKDRSGLPVEARDEKAKLTREIAMLDTALDALKAQSDETALLVPLRLALPSVRLDDCTVAATVTCTAAIYVYPYGRGVFPREVLFFQSDPTGPARFTVKFFEEEEAPARQVAYLVASERAKPGPPKTSVTLAAVASIGMALDPEIRNDSESRNCPGFCESKPYDGDRREHFTGAGRIDVTQMFGNLLDGKVSIGFKEKDLGGGDSAVDVKLSQYRFNLYSEPGLTLHYGKFNFAAPSSGIAINETGEGARIAFHNYAFTGIVKRESDANVSNDEDLDHDVLLFEANNISLTPKQRTRDEEDYKMGALAEVREPSISPLRTLSLVYLRGNDRKAPVTTEDDAETPENEAETTYTAHDYTTYGGQIGFTVPRFFYGSLSVYASERGAAETNAPCGNLLYICDGSGNVGLLTLTRPFGIDEEGKSARSVTLTFGRGSGDDPATVTEDEGYIGETPSFAPDQIFLASFAKVISTRDFTDQGSLDIGVIGIGGGLSNKRYIGVKLVENTFSPLEFLAVHAFRVPKADIRSRSMTFTYNNYRLNRGLSGHHDAGHELDAEFSVETPRSVKIILKGGYYWRGDAVRPFIHQDTWTVSSGISISL